jgi:hypothetical protein
MGHDNTKWFGNTELAARSLIGNETVRYVSNVSRYYMAYSLGHTMECLKHQHVERLKSTTPPQAPSAETTLRR